MIVIGKVKEASNSSDILGFLPGFDCIDLFWRHVYFFIRYDYSNVFDLVYSLDAFLWLQEEVIVFEDYKDFLYNFVIFFHIPHVNKNVIHVNYYNFLINKIPE